MVTSPPTAISLLATCTIPNAFNLVLIQPFSHLKTLFIKILCLRAAVTARIFPLEVLGKPPCRLANFDDFGFFTYPCISSHDFFWLSPGYPAISLPSFSLSSAIGDAVVHGAS
jgi:hypothetical protein